MAFPVKVWHFQCRQFPHAGSCVIFALHISLVSYLDEECPSILCERFYEPLSNHQEIYTENEHQKSHIQHRLEDITSPREDPLLTLSLFWIDPSWIMPSKQSSSSVREGLSFIHLSTDGHLRTRNGELSGFLLIHSTVFKWFCYV